MRTVSVFDYLAVLISIVLGLALAHVLTYFARLIARRHEARVYWPGALWMAIMFVLVLLAWWSDFSLVHHRTFSFAAFIVAMLVPSLLYVMCVVLFPHEQPMREAYWQHNRAFFLLFIAALLATFLQTFLIDGAISTNIDSLMKLLLLLVLAGAAAIQIERLHKAVVVFAAALMVVYVSTLFSTITI